MLSANTIAEYVQTQDMITGYLDLHKQLQPNGFDFTLDSIQKIQSNMVVISDVRDRTAPETYPVLPHEGTNTYVLEPHSWYVLKLRERVELPTHVGALARPRSSFLRVGASIHTAVWDAGYEGNSTVLLHTGPNRIYLDEGTRVVQMVFFELDKDSFAYDGIYQGE